MLTPSSDSLSEAKKLFAHEEKWQLLDRRGCRGDPLVLVCQIPEPELIF
jgi:hypothetical protein